MKFSAAIVLSCVALAGCSTHLHGNQSAGGGASTTTTSSAVTGSANVAGGKVAFSSGSAPSPNAPGGHVALGRSASAVLVLGLVIVDAVSYFVSSLRGAPSQTAAPPTSIADTCSCYGYKPVTRDQ